MKILITGAEGQLGKQLVITFKTAGYEVIPFAKSQLDITNQQQVIEHLQTTFPHIVINAAAFTNVDQCEKEVEKAFLVNGLGPSYLATEASKINASFFQISTDYVFNGDKSSPYKEEDVADAKSVYGKSKRLGEKLSLLMNKRSSIIRTSWLFGQRGENFVKKILDLSEGENELKIVYDQIGSPTYTKDLAQAILKLIDKPFDIYHITNLGSCSKYEFAKEIIIQTQRQNIVTPITTEVLGIKTPRPGYSVLSNEKLYKTGIKMRHWKEALKEYLEEELNISND
ncbi:dTDP-4-dehydrorhamnose reductase [Metabacillus fastidiosus]|uniref:dTDP-4-dehydrorhamnose reductase n=1 Tax=Metabacillus fastidiosus TaxID=1458 RepID=UPI002E215F84|nr:dTDP-4-dehydrorhamnose reductase [Metabacillus fastidiosus]MED4533617.1 dTDP-4-dehydrorhamnose reductase [Metabacillus fastidiosus]